MSVPNWNKITAFAWKKLGNLCVVAGIKTDYQVIKLEIFLMFWVIFILQRQTIRFLFSSNHYFQQKRSSKLPIFY